MKILLACSSGMSTSLLVNKMKQVAEANHLDAEIWAVGQTQVNDELQKADVLLFGPQMRFLKPKFEPKCKELNVPVEVIDVVDYGKCDGKAVLKKAIQMYKAAHKK